MARRPVRRYQDDDPWNWGGALDLLFQHRNVSGVLDLLADGAPVPSWVRKMLKRWREEGWPSLPSSARKPGDAKLIAAAKAYHDKATKQRGETAEARKARIAGEHGTTFQALAYYLNSQSGLYKRELAWKRWEKVWLDPDSYDPD